MPKKKFGKDAILHWQDTKRWCGMPITFTKYYIIEKPNSWIKLFEETGMLHTQIEEVHLYKIDDFSIYESITNKMFGVGNIEVYHNDSSSKSLTITRVKKPFVPYNLLTELIDKDRQRRNIKVTEFQRQ